MCVLMGLVTGNADLQMKRVFVVGEYSGLR
jgi:hypothetical protein